ncbi:hypothetical protein ACNQFG_01355 [Faecalibacterium prausnitzii]|uniref:hypothetical protein n=1 Tax=Faecalibacterium prausnitzii TaxID=853 RepID=UPI003C2BCFC6
MSQSLSRRSFLKCAGSGAVSLAAALLTGVSAAALAPCYEGEPALLDGKAAVELLGYAPAQEMGSWCTSRWRTSRQRRWPWARAICRAAR